MKKQNLIAKEIIYSYRYLHITLQAVPCKFSVANNAQHASKPRMLALSLFQISIRMECFVRNVSFLLSIWEHVVNFSQTDTALLQTNRDITRTLIGRRVGVHSYIIVLPDEFLFKLINLNLIWNWTRRAEHEYINLLYTQALDMSYSTIWLEVFKGR